ncbi:MAG: murein biosynthesis integral membrane protein MurJ [Candidatus Paceibacterota bacterium]
MVKKIFNFFGKEINGLHEAAYLLGFFALLSQFLGLIRDRLLASSFGAGRTLDIYYSAFRIPDFIFVTVASLVSISVLVPFIIEKTNISKEETKKFIDNIFSFFFLLIILVSAIAFFLIPILSPIIFRGFSSSDIIESIKITQILLLSPIFLGLSNFFGSITQVYKRFFIYSLSPLVYNLAIISGLIFLYPLFGLSGLVWGVVLGALLHLAIQLPFVFRQGMFPTIRAPWKIDLIGLKKVLILSVPRTITLGASQIAIIVLLGLASFMEEGSIAVFNFSFNLQGVPLSIIGVSYSVAAFPTLSKFFSSGQKDKFVSEMIIAVRHIIFWSIPISILFIVLRAQIVRTILGAGEFDWSNTKLTAAALALFSISAIAQSLILLFIRGYYASGNTKKPLLASLFSGCLIIIFAFFFTKIFETVPTFQYFIESLFRVSDLSGTSILMLPLAYTLAVSINCLILWYSFGREFAGFTKALTQTLFHTFSASVIMGLATYFGLNIFDNIFDLNTLFGIFMQGFLSGIFGIIVGIIILKLLKNQEIEEVWKTLHHKIWKAKPLPAEVVEI